MNTSSNLKDKISNICAVIIAIAGAILGLTTAGIVLPPIIITIATGAGILAAAVVAFLTGKTPAVTTKTTGQVIEQNTPLPPTGKS